MRFCSKCYTCKKLSEFYKQKDGLNTLCKLCIDEKSNAYRIKYRKTSVDKEKFDSKSYYKKYYALNKDKIYTESRKLKSRIYYNNNKDKRRAISLERYYNNRESCIKRSSEYILKKSKSDPIFKLRQAWSKKIVKYLKSYSKFINKNIELVLGCSKQQAREHIEQSFKTGMNWDNHGVKTWHIDHIKPLSIAKTENELLELYHYTNMQALFYAENISKGNKII